MRYKIGEKDPGTACGNQKEAADIMWYLGVLPNEYTYAPLQDDTKQRAIVRIPGATGFVADDVSARLLISGDQHRALASDSVARSGNDLLLGFPSPAAWNIAETPDGKKYRS